MCLELRPIELVGILDTQRVGGLHHGRAGVGTHFLDLQRLTNQFPLGREPIAKVGACGMSQVVNE
jgi:hypothetical protein